MTKNNSRRYTTQEYYDKLLEQEKEAAERERRTMLRAEERELRIMSELGSLTTSVNQIAKQPEICQAYFSHMNERDDDNKKAIEKVNDKVNKLRIWEGFNTLLAGVASFLGIRRL